MVLCWTVVWRKISVGFARAVIRVLHVGWGVCDLICLLCLSTDTKYQWHRLMNQNTSTYLSTSGTSSKNTLTVQSYCPFHIKASLNWQTEQQAVRKMCVWGYKQFLLFFEILSDVWKIWLCCTGTFYCNVTCMESAVLCFSCNVRCLGVTLLLQYKTPRSYNTLQGWKGLDKL